VRGNFCQKPEAVGEGESILEGVGGGGGIAPHSSRASQDHDPGDEEETGWEQGAHNSRLSYTGLLLRLNSWKGGLFIRVKTKIIVLEVFAFLQNLLSDMYDTGQIKY
jgi:hypothetical protein